MGITMEDVKALQLSEANVENEKNKQIANIDYKMVGFSLAGKDYAIDIMKVKEIAKAGSFTFVPNTEAFVLGVYNLRGEIIPIIDLRVFFNIDVPERTSNEVENLIIVSIKDRVFGVVVDGIDKVVGIQKKNIQPPHPLFGDINIKYIYGIIENNDHLYILLDIDRVFGITDDSESDSVEKVEKTEGNSTATPVNKGVKVTEIIPVAKNSELSMKYEIVEEPKIVLKNMPVQTEDIDCKFISEALLNFVNFTVSDVNENWFQRRYNEWVSERGTGQITSEEQAKEFLQTFYSRYSGELWQEDYCKEVMELLPDNNAKQINIWNPGCGKGFETFSLACVFKERYPNSKIKIYAQDFDLLNISNASVLSIQEDKIPEFFKKYVVKTVKDAYSFSQEVKDSIQFEYHDCTHNNTNPSVDHIFIRDFLSFISAENIVSLLIDIEDKLKGNGTIIVGDNEILADHSKWSENSNDFLTLYSKI